MKPRKQRAEESGGFHSFDLIRSIFEQVLASSVADETELVWFERRYGSAGHPDRSQSSLENPRLTVLVRVIEGRRQGWHRTETADANQLESGLRQALALAKGQPKAKKRPVLPTKKVGLAHSPELIDQDLRRLDLAAAHKLLQKWCGKGATGRLSWSETQLVIANSHGLRRRTASTEVTFQTVVGEGPGRGYAAGSARGLNALEPEAICRRARQCQTGDALAAIPTGPVPVLLAPEATIELLNVLNAFALSSSSFLEGTSFLNLHRGVQVFDRGIHLRDDATRLPGLPFPFDLEGSPKKPLDLIVEGQPSTPALNRYQGGQLGLAPTAQAVGGQDSMFGNLFLMPGSASSEELWAAADGGLSIGWLEPPECLDPAQLKTRVRARGVRRIENGAPGAPLPDLIWEDTLLRALARLRAVGAESVVRVTPTTPLGAISAPALVLVEGQGFQPAR